jgi:hypothetical protein
MAEFVSILFEANFVHYSESFDGNLTRQSFQAVVKLIDRGSPAA